MDLTHLCLLRSRWTDTLPLYCTGASWHCWLFQMAAVVGKVKGRWSLSDPIQFSEGRQWGAEQEKEEGEGCGWGWSWARLNDRGFVRCCDSYQDGPEPDNGWGHRSLETWDERTNESVLSWVKLVWDCRLRWSRHGRLPICLSCSWQEASETPYCGK